MLICTSKKCLLILALPLAMMGCSAMSLQCGVDGVSSYVNLNTPKADLVHQVGYIAKLCGFAEKEQKNAT